MRQRFRKQQSPAAVEAAPQCPYCGRPSVFHMDSSYIYRGQNYGPVFECEPCGAYVGAHRATLLPMGTLANKPLRILRMQCHKLFDPLYKDLSQAYPEHGRGLTRPAHNSTMRGAARTRAYRWLAAQLNIPLDDCHIAMFREDRCREVIALLTELQPTSATVRSWSKKGASHAAANR